VIQQLLHLLWMMELMVVPLVVVLVVRHPQVLVPHKTTLAAVAAVVDLVQQKVPVDLDEGVDRQIILVEMVASEAAAEAAVAVGEDKPKERTQVPVAVADILEDMVELTTQLIITEMDKVVGTLLLMKVLEDHT
jgi:hypothetical protein